MQKFRPVTTARGRILAYSFLLFWLLLLEDQIVVSFVITILMMMMMMMVMMVNLPMTALTLRSHNMYLGCLMT